MHSTRGNSTYKTGRKLASFPLIAKANSQARSEFRATYGFFVVFVFVAEGCRVRFCGRMDESIFILDVLRKHNAG